MRRVAARSGVRFISRSLTQNGSVRVHKLLMRSLLSNCELRGPELCPSPAPRSDGKLFPSDGKIAIN